MSNSPPPGLDLNENKGPSALEAVIVTRTLAFIATVLRFVARGVRGTPYWWDDWIILAGTVCRFMILSALVRCRLTVTQIILIPGLVIEITETNLGLGRHIWWMAEHETQKLNQSVKARPHSQLLKPFQNLSKWHI